LVLASACSIFLGAPTEKARLIHAPDFPVPTNNIMSIAKSARKPNAALMKPVQPDDALAKIVGSKPL